MKGDWSLKWQQRWQVAKQRQPSVVVPSPCISVCQMETPPPPPLLTACARCQGCYRTLDEIGAWSRLNDDQKYTIWEAIQQRSR